MAELAPLFQSNRRWASNIFENNPDYFRFLSSFHRPEYLWIGCSDARVPANEIVGLSPGELFVHRNIANMVVHTDLNCLSVIQYAVDVLKVRRPPRPARLLRPHTLLSLSPPLRPRCFADLFRRFKFPFARRSCGFSLQPSRSLPSTLRCSFMPVFQLRRRRSLRSR